MKIVCISDTHDHFPEVPDGDVLIHAGDWTGMGEPERIQDFFDWIMTMPHKHKVAVAGNHDFGMERRAIPIPKGLIYLNDSGRTIEGLKFWGSPITPTFGGWAFMRDRGYKISITWSKIPRDTDVLITHGPPLGILDMTDGRYGKPDHVGCYDLRREVEAVNPKLHVFGHIHNAYGEVMICNTRFVNASICNEDYEPVNKPIVVEL